MPCEASSTEYSPTRLLPVFEDLFLAICHLKSSGHSDRKDFPWLGLPFCCKGPVPRAQCAPRPIASDRVANAQLVVSLATLVASPLLLAACTCIKTCHCFPKKTPFLSLNRAAALFPHLGNGQIFFLRCCLRICVLPGFEVVWLVVVGIACNDIPPCMEGLQGCWIIFPDLFGFKRLRTWPAI